MSRNSKSELLICLHFPTAAARKKQGGHVTLMWLYSSASLSSVIFDVTMQYFEEILVDLNCQFVTQEPPQALNGRVRPLRIIVSKENLVKLTHLNIHHLQLFLHRNIL